MGSRVLLEIYLFVVLLVLISVQGKLSGVVCPVTIKPISERMVIVSKLERERR